LKRSKETRVSDVEDLQRQLADVQERLDFAERVLARREERAGALPKPGGA
jgi:Tfp pilus assembly protein PilO